MERLLLSVWNYMLLSIVVVVVVVVGGDNGSYISIDVM